MEKNNNLVSIIVPVYNAEKWIEDTILSVKSQTYKEWELILVDDGSTDSSASIIKEYVCDRIKYIKEGKNNKAAITRNLGIREANGRYIAFIDADDLWLNDKLEKQLAFIERTGAAFSFTGYEFADASGLGVQKIVHVPSKITYRQAIKNTTIFTSTVIFDMNKLSKEDIYMPEVPSEDTATWWKVLKKEEYAYGLDEALTLYRRTELTLSSNKFTAIRRIWNLYRNVEHFNIFYSLYCFIQWAIRAVIRRM